MNGLKFEEGELRIDLGEMVASMTEEQRREVARHLVFQEELLVGVCDALAEGAMWVDDENGHWWHGSDLYTRLRLKLKGLMPRVIAKAVEEIHLDLERARLDANHWRDACFALERAWDEKERPNSLRSLDDFEFPKRLTREQVQQWLKDKAKEIDRG